MWVIVALALFGNGTTGHDIPKAGYEGPAVIAAFDSKAECDAALDQQLADVRDGEIGAHQTPDVTVFGICWDATPSRRS